MFEELDEAVFQEEDDREVVEAAAEYLEEEYAEVHDQGPIYITGSAVYGDDPNDYDLSVQRQAEDERDFRRGRRRPQKRPNAVAAEFDYRAIAGYMRDVVGDSVFEDYDEETPIERVGYLFQSSRSSRALKIGQEHNPVTRFLLDVDEVDLDITFTPDPPVRESIQLTGPHRRF